jgi:hypothetical protein
MRDLQQALEHISVIRTQLARGTQFRGYGPASTAATGLLALAVALGQSWWFRDHKADPETFVMAWVATAMIGATVACWNAVVRSRLLHGGLAREMVQRASEQFTPAVVAGLLLTVILVRGSPGELWMLPGLWAIAFSLGIFASCHFLPRPVFAVALWYLIAGLTCLAWQAGTHQMSPWSMGIPFGLGQLAMAAILQHGYDQS